MFLKLLRHIDDVADFVGQFSRAGVDDVVSHVGPLLLIYVVWISTYAGNRIYKKGRGLCPRPLIQAKVEVMLGAADRSAAQTPLR
jgi:hypothetical protein